MIALVQNVAFELVAGVLFYVLGVLTARLWNGVTKSSKENRLRESIQLAIDAIYSAEKSIKGHGKGAQKLDIAVRRYMVSSGLRDYDKAQEHILKVFAITALSKLD